MKFQYIDNTSGSVTLAATANVNRVLNFKNSQSLVGSKTLGAQVLRNEVVLTTPVTISVKPEGCDDSCSATILQATVLVRVSITRSGKSVASNCRTGAFFFGNSYPLL